jgi:alcohol dehydrogenase, propanol-preferring
VGAGSLGQMAVQILKALTAVHVVAVDLHGRREAPARESGADAFVDSLDAEAVRDALEHRFAAAVVDLVGSDSSLALACAVVAPQGRVVATGLGAGRLRWSPERMPAEATLTTTRWGSRAELAEVVALAQAGRLFMRTERFPLGAVADALGAVSQGGVDGRAVLVP